MIFNVTITSQYLNDRLSVVGYCNNKQFSIDYNNYTNIEKNKINKLLRYHRFLIDKYFNHMNSLKNLDKNYNEYDEYFEYSNYDEYNYYRNNENDGNLSNNNINFKEKYFYYDNPNINYTSRHLETGNTQTNSTNINKDGLSCTITTQEVIRKEWVIILIFVLSFLKAMFITTLFIYHYVFITKGITTYENSKYEDLFFFHGNFFSKGSFIKNIYYRLIKKHSHKIDFTDFKESKYQPLFSSMLISEESVCSSHDNKKNSENKFLNIAIEDNYDISHNNLDNSNIFDNEYSNKLKDDLVDDVISRNSRQYNNIKRNKNENNEESDNKDNSNKFKNSEYKSKSLKYNNNIKIITNTNVSVKEESKIKNSKIFNTRFNSVYLKNKHKSRNDSEEKFYNKKIDPSVLLTKQNTKAPDTFSLNNDVNNDFKNNIKIKNNRSKKHSGSGIFQIQNTETIDKLDFINIVDKKSKIQSFSKNNFNDKRTVISPEKRLNNFKKKIEKQKRKYSCNNYDSNKNYNNKCVFDNTDLKSIIPFKSINNNIDTNIHKSRTPAKTNSDNFIHFISKNYEKTKINSNVISISNNNGNINNIGSIPSISKFSKMLPNHK